MGSVAGAVPKSNSFRARCWVFPFRVVNCDSSSAFVMRGCGALTIWARSCPHPASAKARMKTAIHVKLERDKYLQGREAPRRYIHTSTGITAHEIERREGRDGEPPVSRPPALSRRTRNTTS